MRSEVTLGGRLIPIRRLRARDTQGELALPSFVFASDRDPLDRHTLEAIACGVSTRKYARSLDSLAETEPRSVRLARADVWTPGRHPTPAQRVRGPSARTPSRRSALFLH